MSALYNNNGITEAWGDVHNAFLEPDKVAAARADDISFFDKLGVVRRVLRVMIKQVRGKLVSVKWLDTDKGRSRFPNTTDRGSPGVQ